MIMGRFRDGTHGRGVEWRDRRPPDVDCRDVTPVTRILSWALILDRAPGWSRNRIGNSQPGRHQISLHVTGGLEGLTGQCGRTGFL